MTHLQQRLADRRIGFTSAQLMGIAYEYGDVDSAIIIQRGEHKGQSEGGYFSRAESNGDLVVLIVRDHKPVTIMMRRSSQTNTAEQLRVQQIVDLTH